MSNYAIAIVKALNKGYFVSGTAIAKNLTISRSRVWQLISQLKASGLAIDAVSGKGYKLTQPVELLKQTDIEQHLQTLNDQHQANIMVFSYIDSTSQYLIKHHKKLPSNSIVLAEAQSAGRGRRGKSWTSSFAGCLAISFYHQFNLASNQLSGLSLVTGLAIVKALETLGVNAQIKWPNDIYVNKQKLAGILIDIVNSNKQQSKVVTGIGLNINIPSTIKQQIDQPIIDLVSIDKKYQTERNKISAVIIHTLNDYYQHFNQYGLNYFLSQWQQYDLLYEQPIIVDQHNEKTKGIAKGINQHGALKVSINGQISILYSGEVSLKLQ
jgi:BirA family biotin operon repressor/biotin-[acetyl-CoA-carboxylase] ligase